MRIVLLNPPVPAGKFTNRDLMGGMGIDDGFGVGLGPRFVSLLKNEGTRLPVISLAFAAALLTDHDVTVLDQSRLDPRAPAALAAVAASLSGNRSAAAAHGSNISPNTPLQGCGGASTPSGGLPRHKSSFAASPLSITPHRGSSTYARRAPPAVVLSTK